MPVPAADDETLVSNEQAVASDSEATVLRRGIRGRASKTSRTMVVRIVFGRVYKFTGSDRIRV